MIIVLYPLCEKNIAKSYSGVLRLATVEMFKWLPKYSHSVVSTLFRMLIALWIDN